MYLIRAIFHWPSGREGEMEGENRISWRADLDALLFSHVRLSMLLPSTILRQEGSQNCKTSDSIQFATFARLKTFLACRRWSTSLRRGREEVSLGWKGYGYRSKNRRATSNRRSDLRISQEPSAVCKHCPEFADPPPDNHLDVRSNPNADSPIRPLLAYQVTEMVCNISAREYGRGLARGRID